MEIKHFCCGQEMVKLSGSKATYLCQKCGKPQTFNKKITIGRYVERKA